ncbi:MAG: hypothetical protein WA828_12725 [Coleofasciculaceae cyanobacterium]
MNNPIIKLLLIGLLMMLLLAPFAGLAPLMLLLLGLGVCWFIWSLVEAFFTADVEKQNKS